MKKSESNQELPDIVVNDEIIDNDEIRINKPPRRSSLQIPVVPNLEIHSPDITTRAPRRKNVQFDIGSIDISKTIVDPSRMSVDSSIPRGEMLSARTLASRKSFMRRTTSFDISRLDISSMVPEKISQKILNNEINIMELPEQLISGMKNVEESVNFGTKGKEIINTSFLLLILLLIRIAPMLVNTEEVFEVYLKSLMEALALDAPTVKFYISFPSVVAGWITFGAGSIFGFVNVFIFMPSLQKLSTYEEVHGISAFKLLARQLSHPFIMFVAIPIILAFAHLGFIIGLYTQSYTLIIISRIVFGCADSLHWQYYIYFIVKDFKKEHFALAVGFVISLDALVSLAQTFVHEIMDLDTFLWMVFGLLFFSFGASLSLPYLDLSTDSIFTHSDFERFDKLATIGEDGKEVETPVEVEPVLNDEEVKESRKRQADIIWGVVIFGTVHISLVLAKFLGIYMFPFRFGGVIWARKNSALDPSHLNKLREGIYYTRAILSPGIGAMLDSEHTKKIEYDRRDGFFKGCYAVLKGSKLHVFGLLFGFFICVVSNILLLYANILPRTTEYYLLSLIYGFGSSILVGTLFSVPWILIRNLKDRYLTHTYAAYACLILFASTFADICNTYIILSDRILIPIWYVVMVYLGLFLTSSLVFIAWISSGKRAKEPKLDAVLIYGKKDDGTDIKEKDETIDDKANLSSYLWLLLYVPLDFIVFIFCLALLCVMSGAVNIVLYLTIGTKAHLSYVKIIFLPIVSLLCVVSMRIAFPELTSEFFGSMFFRRTRALLGLVKLSTIGKKLENNSEFSISVASLQKKLDIWRYLNSDNVEKKPTIIVYKDEIVLRKEEERIKIIEDTSNLKYEEYDAEECCNGTILVPKDALEKKSIYNYPEQYQKEYVLKKWKGLVDFRFFTDNFFLGIYTGYCLFFTIPIFYRIGLKMFCSTCGDVLLFDDNIAALVTVINFVFGFFILIPFIGLWQEISRILENMAELTFIFKNYTNNILKPAGGDWKKMTREHIQTWSLMFTHLNSYVLSRASFIKYIFIVSYSVSKIISILFSLVALFVRVSLSQEILQLIFVVLLLEFAVLRYIITPASVSTNEMRLTMKEAHLHCSHFLDYVSNQKELGPVDESKMRQTVHYWRDVIKAWEGQTQLGFVGFQFRLNEIGTAWPITADFMRGAVSTTFITIIPAVLTYFVKLLA